MAWPDRLKEAAYTPPSGTRFTFFYENVSRDVSKKTAAFNFPDADGTLVQDSGASGRRYPLRIFFWGDDHDLEANAFIDALLERGQGLLEHPLYGAKNVVPFGDISQRDDLKDAANQSIFDVTFYETIGFVYPSSQAQPAQEVIDSVAAFNTASAGQFDTGADLDGAIEQAEGKGFIDTLLADVSENLQGIADTVDSVKAQFDAIKDAIDTAIDVLIAQPLTLATEISLLIQAPARAVAAIQARLEAYGNLGAGLLGVDASSQNDYAFRILSGSAAVTGSIVSVVNNQFDTRAEALNAADEILSQFEAYLAWLDANAAALGIVDTGEAYQALLNAVALTAGFLVEISFTLKVERSIILDRNRTIVDLAGELYGEVDPVLDFLITSNNLTGSEIKELPAGKRIVYYV